MDFVSRSCKKKRKEKRIIKKQILTIVVISHLLVKCTTQPHGYCEITATSRVQLQELCCVSNTDCQNKGRNPPKIILDYEILLIKLTFLLNVNSAFLVFSTTPKSICVSMTETTMVAKKCKKHHLCTPS